MKLGDYVQISTTVSDLAVALAFYKKLGFKQVANAYHISLFPICSTTSRITASVTAASAPSAMPSASVI